MTNFEWLKREITDYCIMKLGFEHNFTINLFKTFDIFDKDVKIILNTLDTSSVELIISKYKELIDKQAEYLSLE